MKKLLLLPLVLLASCATTPATSPFKTGDAFIVSGTTKDGVNVSFTAQLRDNGSLDDNYWEYDADGSATDSAFFIVKANQEYAYAEDFFKGPDGKTNMVAGCYVYPTGPGWKQATGFLIRETRAEFDAFWKRVKGLSGSDLRFELRKTAGDCMITRK